MSNKNGQESQPIVARLGEWTVEFKSADDAVAFFSRISIGGVKIKPAPAVAVITTTPPTVRITNALEAPKTRDRKADTLSFLSHVSAAGNTGVAPEVVEKLFGVSGRGLGPIMGGVRGLLKKQGLQFESVVQRGRVGRLRRWLAGPEIGRAIDKLSNHALNGAK
jgi:hypothetical protein